MKIILPKTFCDEVDLGYGPLFFLAGPVRGGGDWQADCCAMIKRRISQFYAVLPNRYDDDHPLWSHRVSGSEDHFDRQTLWERHYLELASTRGCILFWLPCESITKPRDPKDGPYARDTYGELGEWRGRMMHDRQIRLVIGAELGFPGIDQIRVNFNAALRKDFSFHKTLAETVEAAIAKTP